MYSYLANPRTTRATLERFGLATRHRLGQNFLVSDEVIGRILGLAELGPDDIVYEVGPGIGTLTVAMLARAGAVVAVEADRRLPEVLETTCADHGQRLALVVGDALRVEPRMLSEALMERGTSCEGSAPTKLVANLPYQVAATVLLRTLEQLPSVRRAVVMVQSEVADRICAHPHTKAYGAYTAKLALHAQVTGRFEVRPSNFLPAPHVNSAVVRLDRRELRDDGDGAVSLGVERIAETSAVIDAAFAQRRKTIRNSMLAAGYARPTLDMAFAKTGIEPGARAETLSPEDFVALAEALAGQAMPAGWREPDQKGRGVR